MSDRDSRLMPSRVVENVKSDVAKQIPVAESLRRGDNIPNGMDTYLAGYIDAHYEAKEKLETLSTLVEEFDRELRELRAPRCHNCGRELPPEWQEQDTPECPECGENPFPPVGDGGDGQ